MCLCVQSMKYQLEIAKNSLDSLKRLENYPVRRGKVKKKKLEKGREIILEGC